MEVCLLLTLLLHLLELLSGERKLHVHQLIKEASSSLTTPGPATLRSLNGRASVRVGRTSSLTRSIVSCNARHLLLLKRSVLKGELTEVGVLFHLLLLLLHLLILKVHPCAELTRTLSHLLLLES